MKNNSNRKSQVTLFIIIVVVMLVIFSIFMIIFSRMGKQKINNVGRNIDQVKIAYDEYDSYMESCLQKHLEDGLYIIGRQGGFLFEGQDGSIIDFDIMSSPIFFDDGFNMYNVTYITDIGADIKMHLDPEYPCYREITSMPSHLEGNACFDEYSHEWSEIDWFFFGKYQEVNSPIRNLDVPLCSEAVIINNTGADGSSFSQTMCNSSGLDVKNHYSIQNQLESYIEFKMDECFENGRTYIQDQIDATIVGKGDFNVSIIFGDDHTSVEITNFRLSLDFERSQSSANVFEFTARTDVRLKKIYTLLYGGGNYLKIPSLGIFLPGPISGIIDLDIENLTYDIEADSHKITNFYDLYNISIRRVYDEFGSYINITDYDSNIRGKPYEYFVRMPNRRPALDYVRDNSGSNEYDIYLYEGEYLSIYPLAFDPDDEGKLDHDLYYEYTVKYNPDNDWTWRQDNFTNSTLFKFGEDGGGFCTHPKYGVTKNRCTRFITNESDVGNHTVIVKVKDRDGLEDWQEVKIFIDQRPNLSFTIENFYDTVPNSYIFMEGGAQQERYIVSLEDPFILNTSESKFPFGGYNTLSWTDTIYDTTYINFKPYLLRNNFRNNFPYDFLANETVIVHPGYSNYELNNTLKKFLANSENININGFGNPPNPSNDNVLSYLQQLDSYLGIFEIDEKWGYPFNPGLSTVASRRSSVLLNHYFKGGFHGSVEEDIFIVDCIPYRSDTPSYPFNLVRTLNDKRNINPYFSNHTCCLGDISNPLTWEYKTPESECYNSYEIGTYSDFIIDESTNISQEVFIALNESFDIFNAEYNLGQILSPEDDSLDRYARILKGECNDASNERGNYCKPVEFSILKLPYCGVKWGSQDYTISETTPLSRIQGYYDFNIYDPDYCVCRNGGSQVYDITGADSSKYCCFDAAGLPSHVSDLPCNVQPCAEYPNTIGTTTFFAPNYGPWCGCGGNPTDTTINGTKFCCNPYGGQNEIYINPADCVP